MATFFFLPNFLHIGTEVILFLFCLLRGNVHLALGPSGAGLQAGSRNKVCSILCAFRAGSLSSETLGSGPPVSPPRRSLPPPLFHTL